MLIDFLGEQQKQFDYAGLAVLQSPEQYLNFDSIADVYAAPWLHIFPKAVHLMVSGLDDGAEHFCIRVEFQKQYLHIDYANCIRVVLFDRFGKFHHL